MSRRFEKDGWFVNDNKLNISLMHYYVTIEVTKDFKYKLTIYDSEMNTMDLIYDNLEEAIGFTEDVLAKEKQKTLIKK